MLETISPTRIILDANDAFRDFEGKPTLTYTPHGPVRLALISSTPEPAVALGIDLRDGYAVLACISLADFERAAKVFAETVAAHAPGGGSQPGHTDEGGAP